MLENMRITTVWFDLGSTLVRTSREKTYSKVLEQYGYHFPVQKLAEEFHLADKYFMRQFPDVFGNGIYSPVPWYLGVVNYRLGAKLDLCRAAQSWREEMTDPHWLLYDDVLPALTELKKRSIRVGLISNWDHTARSVLETVGISAELDPIIVSAEVGHEKPAAEIFEIALQRAGVSACESLYVGDNYYHDTVGSRKVGMKSLIINRFGRLGMEEISDGTFIDDLRRIVDHLSESNTAQPT
jgi:putative hydrolase of the HAD superfamily